MTAGVRFSRREKAALLLEIVSTYAWVRVLLWRRQLPEIVRTLRALDPKPAIGQSALEWRRYGLATVRTLEALPADSRCLMRALTLMAVLGRRGVETQLVIGVSHRDSFRAHAWIERGGQALLWPGQNYTRLTEL